MLGDGLGWTWLAEAWVRWMVAMGWQVALLAGVVWGVTKLLPKSCASFRYALWLLVFVKLVLPPDLAAPWSAGNAIKHVSPALNLSVFPKDATATARPPQEVAIRWEYATSGATPQAVQPGGPKQVWVTSSAALPTATGASQPVPASGRAPAAAPVFITPRTAGAAMGVWAAVGVGMFTLMAVQFRRYRRRVTGGLSPVAAPVAELASEQAQRLGIRRPFEIKSSPHLRIPAVLGVWRPTVLLPEHLVDELPREQLASLICHELAHVQRRDIAWGWASALLLCLYWFHPAVWLASLHLRREREMACDDKVLYATRQEGEAYAKTILRVAESFDGSVPAGAGFLGLLEIADNLLQRIRSVSDMSRPRRAGLRSAGLVAMLAVLLIPMGIWTSVSEAAGLARVEQPATIQELPGELVFKGSYKHRSRGQDLSEAATLWLKQTEGEGLIAAVDLPALSATSIAISGADWRVKRYVRHPSPGRDNPVRSEMDFDEGTVTVRYQGGEKDGQVESFATPPGARFDPNSRPDPYAAAHLLVRKLLAQPDQPLEFDCFDWDNSGKGMAGYRIRIENTGHETLTVPAGTFKANHFVQTQTSFGDTWFKKRPNHVTHFWVLDGGVILRILRLREPYEVLLASFESAEPLPLLAGPAPAGAEPAPMQAASAKPATVEQEIKAHYAKAEPEIQEYIRWTATTFGRAELWRHADAYKKLRGEEREKKVQYMIEVLAGDYGRHLCSVLADAGSLQDERLLPGLIKAAAYHRTDQDYDCRPKWMAVSALGRQGNESAMPTLIPLVDHGNKNTRMWARASLVRLTGQNFGDDKKAWGKWWNDAGNTPAIDLSQLVPWIPVGGAP